MWAPSPLPAPCPPLILPHRPRPPPVSSPPCLLFSNKCVSTRFSSFFHKQNFLRPCVLLWLPSCLSLLNQPLKKYKVCAVHAASFPRDPLLGSLTLPWNCASSPAPPAGRLLLLSGCAASSVLSRVQAAVVGLPWPVPLASLSLTVGSCQDLFVVFGTLLGRRAVVAQDLFTSVFSLFRREMLSRPCWGRGERCRHVSEPWGWEWWFLKKSWLRARGGLCGRLVCVPGPDCGR